MTIQQMNYILEIDRCGSMNKAAQVLFVSQSALSSAILEVEKELGITIFHRSNRGILLTEDGRELVSQITPIVEQSQRLSRYYGQRKHSDRIRFSVAAQRYPFCAKAFVAYMNSLGQLPMQMSLKETDMAAVIGEVASGMSDLGVIFISDHTEKTIIRSLEEKNLIFEPLVTLHPHVFMRKGHPLSGKSSLSLEQLRAFPHVVFTQSESNFNFAEEAVFGSGLDFDRMVYVNDRASIYNVMVHTDCVSTGSGVLPKGYADGNLIAIPLRDSCDMRLGYVYQRQHHFSKEEKHFIDILRAIASESVE